MGPVAHVDVPEIGKVGEHLDDLAAVVLPGDAVLAQELVGGEPEPDRHAAAHGLQRVFEQLAQKPHPVLERAAVFVRPAVAASREEIHGQSDVVAAIDVDQIEARISGPQDAVAVPAAKLADIVVIHGTRLNRVMAVGGRRVRRPQRDLPAVEVGERRAVADEFGTGQRAMRVDRIGPVPHADDVVLVPKLRFRIGSGLGMRGERTLLGTHDSPSALGLHASHGGVGARQQVAHAAAVRHLEEAVAGRHGADLDRLEEDIEAGIAGHGFLH